jgi:hypothetical protein
MNEGNAEAQNEVELKDKGKEKSDEESSATRTLES